MACCLGWLRCWRVVAGGCGKPGCGARFWCKWAMACVLGCGAGGIVCVHPERCGLWRHFRCEHRPRRTGAGSAAAREGRARTVCCAACADNLGRVTSISWLGALSGRVTRRRIPKTQSIRQGRAFGAAFRLLGRTSSKSSRPIACVRGFPLADQSLLNEAYASIWFGPSRPILIIRRGPVGSTREPDEGVEVRLSLRSLCPLVPSREFPECLEELDAFQGRYTWLPVSESASS